MAATLRVSRSPGGEFLSARGVLPGAITSTVGYDSSGITPQLHRGLPSPHLTFIFSLGDPIVSASTPARALSAAADRSHVLVAGLHAAPTYVVQPCTQTGIQLAVHPLAARVVLGAPAARLPGEVTEGVDLLGPEVERVREQLGEVADWSARFAIVARYLRSRVVAAGEQCSPRPELVAAWTWLSRRHGAGSMDDLAQHVALSGRQLRALFAFELGVGPKQVARLMRFEAATHQIAASTSSGRDLALSDIAARCGYYDHAHLDAEFRTFVGISPTAWIAEERRNIQAGGHRSGEDWAA